MLKLIWLKELKVTCGVKSKLFVGSVCNPASVRLLGRDGTTSSS